MPRTWSYAKRRDPLSPVERARSRPSSQSAFLIALALVVVFFLGITVWVAVRAEMHPLTEAAPSQSQR